jgi:hypothetical protein
MYDTNCLSNVFGVDLCVAVHMLLPAFLCQYVACLCTLQRVTYTATKCATCLYQLQNVLHKMLQTTNVYKIM